MRGGATRNWTSLAVPLGFQARSGAIPGPMAKTVRTGGAPSRDAAFVVHLADTGDATGDQAHGRVEHVRSGRVATFDSMHALLRFMRETLAAVDAETDV